ncbi:MAG TPA: hypothetical protein EYH01_06165 [Campylobacterales bacterium]|nr:hypothetical protein [Campylobacterales bacterium]
MYKMILIILTATLLNANAGNYNIKFKGFKLGEIETLDTLKENYLKAEVTSRIARFFIRYDNFVFHGGDKPAVKDAKFRKDKNMLLFAFLQTLTEKPKHKVYKINDIKTMTIDCDANECRFVYNKKGRVKGRGVVTFDSNGEFVKLKEEIASVEISKI